MPTNTGLKDVSKRRAVEAKALRRSNKILKTKVEKMALEEPLTVQQSLLVEEFLKDFNKTQAYRRAYNDETPHANTNARKIFQSKNVRREIQARLKDIMYDKNETQAKLQDIAEVNPEDFIDIDETTGMPSLNLKKAKARGQLQHLRKFNLFKNGSLKNLELADPIDGIDRVAKTLKMFGDDTANPYEKPTNPLKEIIDRLHASDEAARNRKRKR